MAAGESIETRDHVETFLFGPVRQAPMIEGISDFEISQTNGQPALILRSKGRIHTGGMIHVEIK